METYRKAKITKILYDCGKTYFTTKMLSDILAKDSPESSFFSILAGLQKDTVLEKIERNTYVLTGGRVHTFALANFLYEPSYVSLETALNYYGILPQFPYETASITPRKSITKIIKEKAYRYVHLKKSLYWGYDLVENFLIAQPEKALLDLLYLSSKGLATAHMDEFDTERVNRKRFKEYARRFPPMKGVDLL